MLLRHRLLVLFLVVVLVLGAVGVFARAVVRNREDAAARAAAADAARTQVSRLDAALTDQETGQRGFVLTGDESFLAPYRQGRAEQRRAFAALDARASDVSALVVPLAAAHRAVREWHTLAVRPGIELRRAGDVEDAIASVEAGAGRALFDQVRERIQVLDRSVVAEAVAAGEARTDSRRALTVTVAGIVVVALVLTLVTAWLIRRWVTRPIDSLVDDVRRAQEGGLDATITSDGPPEIAEFATAIDSMRSRINASRILAARAREAIEQDASVVSALRSQLEPEVGELPRGWTIAAELRAAAGVAAGDCYDLVRLSGERIALIIIDISGHGATEGLLALRCKELLRASLAADVAPGPAINAAATQMGDMGSEVFLTAFVAVIDTNTGSVEYANAGHPPSVVCAPPGDVELGPTGPLVGLLSSSWRTGTASMGPGDALCAYTDGLIEVRSAQNEFFGPERLFELVRASRCDEAAVVVKRVLEEVEVFAPGRLHDDATIVVLCRSDDSASSVS